MTDKQKQCLLCYLGYYGGHVDGIWGQRSSRAAEQFCADHGLKKLDAAGEAALKEAVLKEVGSNEDWWDKIRYFTREEFACKCGKFCDGAPAEMARAAVELADGARAHFRAPATVVSGLRCARHNTNVGGVENSQHMYGEAVDLRIRGVSAADLLAYLRRQPGVRYAYAINDTNVHFDIPKGQR